MKRIPLLLIGLLLATPADAQTRTPVPLLLQLPASARAAGMGNAFPLAAVDADVLFYQPAQIASARGFSATFAAYGTSTMAFSIATAGQWWDGGIAFGLRATSYGADSFDDGAYRDGEAGLIDEGAIASSEVVGTAGYARSLFGFRVGLAGKLAETRVAGERDVTAAGDVGIARGIGFVTLAFSARNLGRDPVLDSLDARLPRTFTLAAATRSRPLGPLDVSLAAAVSRWEDGTFVPEAGAELAYWPIPGRTFIARIGSRYVEDSDIGALTLGAGFAGDRISIDYAFAAIHGEAVHRVGVRLR
jgi:hypothetical protein